MALNAFLKLKGEKQGEIKGLLHKKAAKARLW